MLPLLKYFPKKLIQTIDLYVILSLLGIYFMYSQGKNPKITVQSVTWVVHINTIYILEVEAFVALQWLDKSMLFLIQLLISILNNTKAD